MRVVPLFRHSAAVLLAVTAGGFTCSTAGAAVTVIGVQYQQDDWFPEFNCIWKDKYYPDSCPVGTAVGCNIHAYVKNTGSSSVAVNSDPATSTPPNTVSSSRKPSPSPSRKPSPTGTAAVR